MTEYCHTLLEAGNGNCAFLQRKEHPQRLISSSVSNLKSKFKIWLLSLLFKCAFMSVHMWKMFSVRKNIVKVFIPTKWMCGTWYKKPIYIWKQAMWTLLLLLFLMWAFAADVAKYNLPHRFATDKCIWMNISFFRLIEDPSFNHQCSLKNCVYLISVILMSVCLKRGCFCAWYGPNSYLIFKIVSFI